MQGFLSPYTLWACIACTQVEPPLPKHSGQDALTRVLETEGDGDAMTRRKQFQMKKHKKEKKKAAKDAKQEKKKQKQQAREEKRKEKENIKEQKADAKRRKLEEKQSKQCKQDASPKEIVCATKSKKRSYQDHSKESHESPRSAAAKPKAHRKKKVSNKRKKLLKMKQATKPHKKKHSNSQETEQSSSMQHSAGSEENPTPEKTVQGGNTPGKTRKSGENGTKVSKQNSVGPCQNTIKQLQDILCECKESHCTHPKWKYPAIPKSWALSVYWSRCAVGVKMDIGDQKVKRKQVAYFGGETSCIYTNMALAYNFVTWSPF